MTLSANDLSAIREDFEAWTGGFAPEDADQIQDYVSNSMGVYLDEALVRDWLLTQIGGWKDEQPATESEQFTVTITLDRDSDEELAQTMLDVDGIQLTSQQAEELAAATAAFVADYIAKKFPAADVLKI